MKDFVKKFLLKRFTQNFSARGKEREECRKRDQDKSKAHLYSADISLFPRRMKWSRCKLSEMKRLKLNYRRVLKLST